MPSIIEDSAYWPLALHMKPPTFGAGDNLVGSSPGRSPELGPGSWASGGGAFVAAGRAPPVSWDKRGKRNPAAMAFYSAVGSATASIDLSVDNNRGLSVYVGFSRLVGTDESGVLPSRADYYDNYVKIELLDGSGVARVSLQVNPSYGSDPDYRGDGWWTESAEPQFDLQAHVYGAAYSITDAPIYIYDWADPWLRMAMLAVSPAGAVEIGFHRPQSTAERTPIRVAAGSAPPSSIASLRVTSSKYVGLASIEIRKLGFTDITPPSVWWRSKVNCVELDDENNQILQEAALAEPTQDWSQPW